MGKRVKIRTLVAESGPRVSWAAGTVIEVDEAEAQARIRDGRAEPIEPPAERKAVVHGGQQAETAAVQAGETRTAIDGAVQGWLAAVEGLTEEQARALVAAGFADVAAVADVSNSDLQAVDGIGRAAVRKIRAAAKQE